MLNQTEAKSSRIILTAENWQMLSSIYRRSAIQTMHDSMSTLHDFEVENTRRAFRFELVAHDWWSGRTGFITEKPCRATGIEPATLGVQTKRLSCLRHRDTVGLDPYRV